jgi:hypothetical protein
MRCRVCGKPVRRGDKNCVNCGAKLRHFPLWITAVSIFALIAVAATLVWLFTPLNPDNRTTTSKMNGPQLLALQQAENSSVQQTTAYSKLLSTTPPIIDGVLTSYEWQKPPALTKTFEYIINGVNKTGNIAIYFINDDSSLYYAMTVTAGDFREEYFKNEAVQFLLSISFDGNNDGTMGTGDDIRLFHIGIMQKNYAKLQSYFEDGHLHRLGNYERDASQDGKGAVTFEDSKSTFTYEGLIPLNSGDPEDLSVKPGDTVRTKIDLSQVRVINFNRSLSEHVGDWTWPIAGARYDINTYGKLVLATEGSSGQQPPVTPVPTPTPTPTTTRAPATTPTPTTPLPGGAVALWSFDEGTGTIVSDTSGNGNNGALYNMDGSTCWVDGKPGKALMFNGIDDYVSIPDSDTLHQTSAITVAFWIKAASEQPSSDLFTVIEKSHSNIDYSGWYFQSQYDKKGVSFGFGNGSDWNNGTGSDVVLADDVWHFVTGTYDGTQVKFYIDGNLESSKITTGQIATNNRPINIGHWGAGERYFKGIIDEVRIYNRALSDAEIQALYEYLQ